MYIYSCGKIKCNWPIENSTNAPKNKRKKHRNEERSMIDRGRDRKNQTNTKMWEE